METDVIRRPPPRHYEHKLILCPLNYSGWSNVSHTGLGVSAMGTARVLRANGINALVFPVRNVAEIRALILLENPTHLVINALWLNDADTTALVHSNPHISFAVLSHSNLAFLAVEPKAIGRLRDAVNLELASLGNFTVAANSRSATTGLRDAWECPVTYLPNLYYLDRTVRTNRPKWSGGTLRIGSFGALRPLKNVVGSAFAALAIGTNVGTNVEFHINSGRNDGGSAGVLISAVQAVFAGVHSAKVVLDSWQPWAGFRLLTRNMHLGIQASFTESFNVVTADFVAEGVPCAASDVVEWTPQHWRCRPDDVNDIARVGRALLTDHHTGHDGVSALAAHVTDGVRRWIGWLDLKLV